MATIEGLKFRFPGKELRERLESLAAKYAENAEEARQIAEITKRDDLKKAKELEEKFNTIQSQNFKFLAERTQDSDEYLLTAPDVQALEFVESPQALLMQAAQAHQKHRRAEAATAPDTV